MYQQGATVVSLFPEEISEAKPGLYPGYFVIPAAPLDGMSFLPIGDSVYYQETKNDQQTQVRVAYEVVAESIVGDFQRGHIGRIPEVAEPAVFWIPGQYVNEESIRDMFGPTILKAEQKQIKWFEELVKIADDTWSRTNRHSSVSHLQRMAAQRLAVTRPWVLRTGDSPNTCGYCKSEVPFGAVKCPTCREIIDMEGYRAMTAGDGAGLNMILLASDVMDESAAVYLNDAAKSRWPYTILLPYLKSAIGVLQAELESNDLPPLHDVVVNLEVPVGTTVLNVPDDFVFPMYLDEKGVGDARFEQMEELSWEPDAEPEQKLKTWVFREGKIQMLGATTERQVKLRYLRSLNMITAANSVIEIPNAKQFLAAETAALASNFGGSATARGTSAGMRAEYFKRLLISALTKRLQDRPVRRRGYRWR